MSVLSEINRIKNAVTDIENAIKEKGVTVPTTTKIGDLAPLVSSISTQPRLQDKRVPPATFTQSITADSGYDGLGTVTVTAMPTGSATTPADTITATNTVTIDASGLITASASGSKSITPTITQGYVSTGTAGTVSVSGTGTKQLTKRTSSSLTASGLTVTAPAGYYHSKATKTLTDSNLVASNIKKDVTIFGVTGTHEGGASIATCTINVKFTTNAGNCLTSATTFSNGAFSAFNSTTKSGTFTIQNVVCGSALSIGTTYMCSLYWSGSQQAHLSLYGGMITVPSASGTYTVEVGALDD